MGQEKGVGKEAIKGEKEKSSQLVPPVPPTYSVDKQLIDANAKDERSADIFIQKGFLSSTVITCIKKSTERERERGGGGGGKREKGQKRVKQLTTSVKTIPTNISTQTIGQYSDCCLLHLFWLDSNFRLKMF